jgi:hypothetical protein
MFIEGERKRKGIGYRIVKIYRYEETLERINLRYNLRIHYTHAINNVANKVEAHVARAATASLSGGVAARVSVLDHPT